MGRFLSIDCETTGLDFHHGAKPFLITTCQESGEQLYWEWRVDPTTRQPVVPTEDIREIRELLLGSGFEWVFHNAKFDLEALVAAGILRPEEIPWERVHDTLYSSHLLSSNTPKDLTHLCLQYLGIDVAKHEQELRAACMKARTVARSRYKDWRTAKAGLPDMPSAKKTVWKYDLWLPREISIVESDSKYKEWLTLCSKYANIDSGSTLTVFLEQREQLKEAGLWDIYEQRRKLVPIVFEMQQRGITVNRTRLDELEIEFRKRSNRLGKRCCQIAKRNHGYDLALPKSGNNGSLTEFVFEKAKFPVLAVSKKTGKPSLDKTVLEEYEASMTGYRQRFVQSLRSKRKCDTSLSYLEGYRRFWLHEFEDWYRLYPSVNPTATDTLRWSSQSPNEQNISKKDGYNLRYAFGPVPGREWWSLDYDNLELRIPAYECQEPAMLELFENPNKPPWYGSYHLLIFSILHPDKYDHNDPKGLVKAKEKYAATWYQWTKNGNFAELYGAVESSGTADRAFHVPGAQNIVANKLTKKSELNRYWIDFAQQHGHVTTLPDTSLLEPKGYPIQCPVDRYGRVLPTVPLNYHVQSTACWIVMQAMIKIREYFNGLQDDCYMVMNVHDEVVIDMPYRRNKRNLPKVRNVRRLMESIGDDIRVKLTCGMKYHINNWSEGISC